MRIAEIRATPLSLPFKEPYHWAGRVDVGAIVVLIEVSTDEGLTGYGESTGNHSLRGVLDVAARAQPLLCGRDVFAGGLLGEVWRACDLGFAPRFGNLALAGLDMALWDLRGKALGRPVHELLGGALHDEVDYFGFIQGDTVDQLAASARALAQAGHQVLYLKVGRDRERDMANCAAVRAVIGPHQRLRLDANEAWDTATALDMSRRLLAFDPELLEQPTPAAKLAALAQVKRHSPLPIAADQLVFMPEDVYEVCRQQAADLIVLGLHETGGLRAFLSAAAIADAAGLHVCLHGQFVSGITDCAQHAAGLLIPNLADGNQIMHPLLQEDLVGSPSITPAGGRLAPLAGPGFGFELDREAVERAAQHFRRNGPPPLP
jgi:muconate cycloisomerase